MCLLTYSPVRGWRVRSGFGHGDLSLCHVKVLYTDLNR